jgi:hypothetical protein
MIRAIVMKTSIEVSTAVPKYDYAKGGAEWRSGYGRICRLDGSIMVFVDLQRYQELDIVYR